MRSLLIEENSKLDLFGKRFVVGTARLGSERLRPGRYTATDDAVSAYVSDTSEGNGWLVVTGEGLKIFVR